ncbi:hypothetical protein TM102_23650 [Bradyrhizobium sp. TM102]|nr:hypothetical protein TM102_23650 [Bradyrhizobium sp. TM102]
MTFTMGVDIERAVQLINRRPAEPAVEDGERTAHAFPSRIFLSFRSAFNNADEIARAESDRVSKSLPGLCIAEVMRQYFLHSGTVRLGSPILEKTAGS